MKIGIFDSGIGGLTVLKEIINKYPNGNYIYYGDTLHLPYGEKTKEQLLEYSCNIIDFLISKGAEKIVIACGTVSSTIYNELITKYNTDIINVIDATTNFININNINKLAVLATSKTIESHIFFRKLKDIDILEIACPKFVPFIENNIGKKYEILNEYLDIIKQKRIEHIILGCTHYPLLENDIKKYFDYPIKCYNMGYFVAKSIKIEESNYNLSLYFSKIDENLKQKIDKIIKTDYKIVEKVL